MPVVMDTSLAKKVGIPLGVFLAIAIAVIVSLCVVLCVRRTEEEERDGSPPAMAPAPPGYEDRGVIFVGDDEEDRRRRLHT